MIISLRIFLRLRNVAQKYVEKHERNYIYIYINIYIGEFLLKRAWNEHIWKVVVQTARPQVAVYCDTCALHVA